MTNHPFTPKEPYDIKTLTPWQVLEPQPPEWVNDEEPIQINDFGFSWLKAPHFKFNYFSSIKPNDKIYLAEEWLLGKDGKYLLSGPCHEYNIDWQPAETMPHEIARVWWIVKEVRVELVFDTEFYSGFSYFAKEPRITEQWAEVPIVERVER